jgi:hypothetical protein
MIEIISRNSSIFVFMACMVASTSSYAQSSLWTFKDNGNGTRIAMSVNGDLSRVGVFCDVSKGCQVFLNMNLPCDVGSTTPLMANSSRGAYVLTSTCGFLGGNQYLIIEQFDDAIGIFESGEQIGFAAPMKDGKFMVIRFSTDGAASAITKARAIPNNKSTGNLNSSQVL